MNLKPLAALVLNITSTLILAGCLPDGEQPTGSPEPIPESSTGTVTLATRNSPFAARTAAAEPGGELVAEIRHAARRLSFRDSAVWSGNGEASLRFPAIPEGIGYMAIVQYRDANGLTTHADTVRDLEVKRTINTQAEFKLRALLGRLQLVVPTAPTTIDTIGLSWESAGRVRATRIVRGPSGRTLLRLDSLAVGSVGKVRVRAWNAAGDTLYFGDTTTSILSQVDQSLQIKLTDTRSQIGLTANFLPGGETDAVALFPDASIASGRLVLAALSDSGSSDWIRLDNRSSDSMAGAVKIVRGTESFTADLHLGSGKSVVFTRASCDAVAKPDHPLHGASNVVCGLPGVSVSWSSTGTLWEIRSPDGILADQIVVVDGKLGWPDLNASTARTVRRAPDASVLDATAGRSWCADASDSPDADTCH